MSATNIPIVTKCKRCGAQVIIDVVETQEADPEGKLLYELTKAAAQNALCKRCRKALQYYSSIGKGDDFMKGRTA